MVVFFFIINKKNAYTITIRCISVRIGEDLIMKFLNKVFIFLSIIIILISCFSPLTSIASADAADPNDPIHYEGGCDTSKTYVIWKNTLVAERVYQYYKGTAENIGGPNQHPVDEDSFKCSIADIKADTTILNPADYKEVMASYYYEVDKDGDGDKEWVLAHTTIYTDYDFSIEDVGIDVDGGRLVISGTLYNDKDAWNQIFNSISGIITGISGLGVLCCILAFILQILRLGAAAGNPAEREKAIKGLLWTGIGTAGCAASALIFGIAYGLL